MHPLVFAKQRLAAFRDEVERLDRAEFPYPAAEAALKRIKEVCDEQATTLALLDEESHRDVLVTPAERTEYIAHILNAGWKAARSGMPQLVNHSSDAVLRELVLKSVDVLEYEAKNQPQHDS